MIKKMSRYSFLIGCCARTPEETKEMNNLREKFIREDRDPGWEDMGKELDES